MTQASGRADPIRAILAEDLTRPLYLTPDEIAGRWRVLFPELASCLPAPYPIFSRDDDRIVAHGYPVLISPGIQQMRRELERHVVLETDFRLAAATQGESDKREVIGQRERYVRSMSAIIENTLLNDYGHGLFEVLLLFHSADVSQLVARVPALTRERERDLISPRLAEEFRYTIAAIFGDLLQRSAMAAADRLRQLAMTTSSPALSPLLAAVCQDMLLLSENHTPPDLAKLRGYLRVRYRLDADEFTEACRHALDRLGNLLDQRPELGPVLSLPLGPNVDLLRIHSLLQPRLLEALEASGLLARIALERSTFELLRDLGQRLKRLELLVTLRDRVLTLEWQGSNLILDGQSRQVPVALSTRPFDFTAPGVVDTSVRRFGLVYDLSSFTAQLEEVRKKGRMSEEKALQFMYIFQSQLEDIGLRRRLTFEKYLGDGAFYSSRRALRIITAACEIQRLYDRLRHSGFPFDKGIRLAMNFGTYRLLPMLTQGTTEQRYEFFGHGIVELARLTTGKSTREVEQIAEFLIHSGFDPSSVDDFLRPLMAVRGGRTEHSGRPYTAWIDAHGELVNEGIVLSLPFLEELERDLENVRPGMVEFDGERWAVFRAEPGASEDLHFGLRHLGVARLKGLQPLELVEVMVWGQAPPGTEPAPERASLIELLRLLASPETQEEQAEGDAIPDELVALTYTEDNGARRWLFGLYDPHEDTLEDTIEVPISTPESAAGDSLELWVFESRHELLRLYEGLHRDTQGVSLQLADLRHRDNYLSCFLNAPHRTPGQG